MFYLPYSHQAALVQAPVPFEIDKTVIMVYPLTVGDILDLNLWVQRYYFNSYKDKFATLPEDSRESFINSIRDTALSLSFQSGKGYEIFMNNKEGVTKLVNHLCHNFVSQEQIDKLIFPYDMGYAQLVVNAMRSCVYRPIPEAPQLKITQRDPRYKTTDEEAEAKLYKILAEKYGWHYWDVLDLTDYQIFWYTYLYPDEREHIEELDEMAHKHDNNGNVDVPYQPGTIHFDSPEEYEAWLATRPPQQQ